VIKVQFWKTEKVIFWKSENRKKTLPDNTVLNNITTTHKYKLSGGSGIGLPVIMGFSPIGVTTLFAYITTVLVNFWNWSLTNE
jgi:hypothetical protein